MTNVIQNRILEYRTELTANDLPAYMESLLAIPAYMESLLANSNNCDFYDMANERYIRHGRSNTLYMMHTLAEATDKDFDLTNADLTKITIDIATYVKLPQIVSMAEIARISMLLNTRPVTRLSGRPLVIFNTKTGMYLSQNLGRDIASYWSHDISEALKYESLSNYLVESIQKHHDMGLMIRALPSGQLNRNLPPYAPEPLREVKETRD